jgi:P4 family phage/plasmid primase-like protien
MASITLRSYIDTKYVTSADWNVTGLGAGWTGKFKIPDDEYDTFLDLVHDHIFNKGRACSLLEKHKPQSPILIDLDFRYAAGGPLRRRFTDEQVRQFVAAYADAFVHFFNPIKSEEDDTDIPLQFFVMLKPAPEVDKETHKDGVHIVCPSITTSPEIQFAIRGWLLQTGVIEQIFGSTGMVNAPQDCLDISVISRNNWFLYGACKPDKAWYKVEHVYTFSIPEEPETITSDHLEEESLDSWTTQELIKLLSIRNGHDVTTKLSLRVDDAAVETDWLQLLQRWGKGSNWAKTKSPSPFTKTTAAAAATTDMPSLSLSGGAAAAGGAGASAAYITAAAASDADEMVQVSGMSVRSGYSTEDIALAYKLVRECLNPTRRAKDYHDWVNTGLLLHNISNTEESYRIWAELSRRVPGYGGTPESIYKDKWAALPAEAAAHMRGRKPLMMGTLHLWAKEDSPATYRIILKESNKELAYLNDSGTHVAVADLVVRMYRHEFRCTPGKKGATASAMDWYQFPSDGHTWRSLKTWMRLRERLSNEVRNIYIEADCEAGKREMATTDQFEKERLQEKRKRILKVETHLQSTGFKDNVMKEVAEKFYDEEFLQHMNQDACLVGFSNGVLELRKPGTDGAPHVFFRPGRPDDCISFQMGRGIVGLDAIPYIPYDPATPAPEHLEINEFFGKIYPDPVLREYALTLFSACLEGANHEQKFYIMSGSGGNGKSKIIDLMSKTFGEYQDALPVTALTRKRADAGSANPEMIVLKCKRFVSMVEPEEGEKINTSLMKQLSGQDTLKARGLYQDQDAFVIMARIFMSCNDLPAVSTMDEGTWRRLLVIPHVSKFVAPGDPINPAANVYSRDPLLDNKIVRWRPYFAGMLVWYYANKYLRSGLSPPDTVTAASRKYKEENDAFVAFCQECLIREAGAEVRVNDVLIRYKEWTKFNPGKKVLQRKDIIQKLTEAYGAPIDAAGKVYAGIRITEEGEDISGNFIGAI